MRNRLRIEVRGIVQGVGFRPYVYRLAQRLSLTGHIHNSDAGVVIEIEGSSENTAAFVEALPREAPPLALLLEIESAEIELALDSEFLILESTRSGSAQTMVSPDIATCNDCLREMLDPSDRRYLYPFINCTNCGPRFTIVRALPYDRGQTSMACFRMCDLCQAEYDDPLNRRFHAQPNACPACGPHLSLVDPNGTPLSGDPVQETIRFLKQGCIVAIKGLGGFHLAVDASQANAVQQLRRRKGRGRKPFAIMVASRDTAKGICLLPEDDAALLESAQRPIVLLAKRSTQFDDAAPIGNHIGIFMPYTPLHQLLVGVSGLEALVMTSGNLSEEPLAIDNAEALARLSGIADYFLLHDREIMLRCDDSVVRRVAGRIQFGRRSRGFVPSPILLAEKMPVVLAVGGELKNTICFSRDNCAFPGQHIGDLESLSAYNFFLESIAHFESLLELKPEVIAHDLHPAYLATRWAESQRGSRVIGVQHHHAHIASCMAENQLTGRVIGVALDGTGYGTDGYAWGGEVLVASLGSFERAAHLVYAPMPGGARAIREPWRMAAGFLWQIFGEQWRSHVPAAWLANLDPREVSRVEQILRRGKLSPLTSSCGRLFDAVAALACGQTHVSYEAEAAIALEACCNPHGHHGVYPFTLSDGECLQIETAPLFIALLDDLRQGVSPGIVSSRFHRGLIEVIAEVVTRIAARTRLTRVCLSGGSFQNAILAEGLAARLQALAVFQHTQVPPGDGGLSLGQLAVAGHRFLLAQE